MMPADPRSQTAALRRYRRLLARRRLFARAVVPVALALLLFVQSRPFGLPIVFGWPLLLAFATGCVAVAHRLDVCPWCARSFHVRWRNGVGRVRWRDLARTRCANCGEPRDTGDPAA